MAPTSKARAAKYQTASQAALPPQQQDLFGEIDRLVRERTRFNATRTHRYTLFRHWGDPEDYIAFVGMNPSGADEAALDRTVAKCERLARKWEWNGRPFGAFYMLNVFGLRATQSAELYQVAYPVGEENDRWISEIAARARLVVVAWGKPGSTLGRGDQVTVLLRQSCEASNVRCFAFNLDGSPAHPLYQTERKTTADLLPFFKPSGARLISA
jgi:hypothetical protein